MLLDVRDIVGTKWCGAHSIWTPMSSSGGVLGMVAKLWTAATDDPLDQFEPL